MAIAEVPYGIFRTHVWHDVHYKNLNVFLAKLLRLNANTVDNLCTVFTVHLLRDCRNSGR